VLFEVDELFAIAADARLAVFVEPDSAAVRRVLSCAVLGLLLAVAFSVDIRDIALTGRFDSVAFILDIKLGRGKGGKAANELDGRLRLPSRLREEAEALECLNGSSRLGGIIVVKSSVIWAS
jgi:hypothetical protein